MNSAKPTPDEAQCLAANETLETLMTLNRHATDCRQCRSDPGFCNVALQYDATFQADFRRWQEIRRQNMIKREAAQLNRSSTNNTH